MCENKDRVARRTAIASLGTAIASLVVFIFFSYLNSCQKNPDLRYAERWDVSQISVFRSYMPGFPPGYFPESYFPGSRVPVSHLIYVVELQNKGNKETDPIRIKFKNLSELEITTNRLVQLPRLEWEPHIHGKPVFKDSILRLGTLGAYNDNVTLTIFVNIEDKSELSQEFLG
jgi:hypothetical protein